MLLIDEVDKTDVEVEGLLLEVLCDFQVTIPELGTVAAVRRPFVVLTSNATRELSEAMKRRCLYLHLDYPDAEREKEILLSQVPELDDQLAGQVVETVARLRELELKKAPSIAESIDWARTLVALDTGTLDAAAVDRTLGVVLKHASDHERAIRELQAGPRDYDSGLLDRHIAFVEALRAPACRSRWPRTSTPCAPSDTSRSSTASPCARRTPPPWSSGPPTAPPSTPSSTSSSPRCSVRG